MLNLPIKILKTIQIEAEQATIEFTGINTLVAQWDAVARVTSRHLVLIVNAASPDAVAKRAVEIEINGDSGANYNHQTLTGENAVPDADRQTAVNALFEYPGLTDYPFAIPGTTYADAFGGGTILFPHAFNTVNHKVALAMGGAAEDYTSALFGRWASAAAITSLSLSPDAGDFAVGSTISLGVIDERYLVEEVLLAADGLATFDNIPQGEGDLVAIGYMRSNVAALDEWYSHIINDDDTVANYQRQYLFGRAGGVPTANSAANNQIGIVTGNTATALSFGGLAATYSQYIKGNLPHYLTLNGYHHDAPDSFSVIISGQRRNIEPINKIVYTPSAGTAWKAGSLFSLYRVPKRIIERVELTAPQATITFDNIPQNFEALSLHVYARSSEGAVADEIAITINADGVAANYNYQELEGTLAAPSATRNVGAAGSQQLLFIPADAEIAGEFGGGCALFPAYAETDRHKHIICQHGRQGRQVIISSHRWESFNAIITIALSPVGGPNFLAGSVFELEGILRKEGLPPSEGQQVG